MGANDANCGDLERFLVGDGLVIGAATSLVNEGCSINIWDEEIGDPLRLDGLLDRQFDFVYSYHSLARMKDVEYALANWARVIRPGGYLCLVLPDAEMRDERFQPSLSTPPHKATFSLRLGREELDSRTSHFHIAHDLQPLLACYGIDLVVAKAEDRNARERDGESRGIEVSDIFVVGRKRQRLEISVFLRNRLGAGDHANTLPIFRYLDNMGYDVVCYKAFSLYRNLEFRDPPDEKAIEIPVTFVPRKNLPGVQLRSELKNRLGVDCDHVVFPGICFSPEEWKIIRELRAKRYVNVFPFTSILQKRVGAAVVKEIVAYLTALGRDVFTTRLTPDEEYPWSALFRHFHPTHTGQFPRRWMLEVAGAELNICCDGGPLNVSLAAGVKTIGLLTIADESLMVGFPSWQHRSVQSSYGCSPCFRSADYKLRLVRGCEHVNDCCGNHFSIDEIRTRINEILNSC